MIRFFALPLFLSASLSASPITSSWFTDLSGKYARIYPTTADEVAIAPVTSWSHPTGAGQANPTYAGVSEISTTATDVYIRTSGLPFHTMGPWYLNAGKSNLFPNYPSNIAQAARFPLAPVEAAMPKPLTGLGAIGYFVDGVSMFDSRDAFSYNSTAMRDATPADGANRGSGVWNRDAYVNEAVTFDPANAHQAGGTHHYHANPAGLRHLVGDSVNYDASSNTYTEVANGSHSPIIAWTFDGFPLYGPYGYSDPFDPNSGVRRMISGYQKRDGTNGATNLATTGRTTIPQWITRNEAGRTNPVATNLYGPAVSTTYPLGHYLEDYAYKGDLGFAHGVDFDLNEYNVRWCATPEFPNGTWAYFSCIATDGTPVFPYNISRYYFGTLQGGNVANLPADREIVFQGGPETSPTIAAAKSGSDVTLTWTGAEGGTYRIDRSEDLDEWKLLDDEAKNSGETTDAARLTKDPKQFYRTSLTSIAPFDDLGYDYAQPVFPVFTAAFSSLPTLSEISSVTVGGVSATVLGAQENSLFLKFSEETLAQGNYSATITYTPSGGSATQLVSTNTHTINPPRNILLLILDDWGIDSSPLDNSASQNPGTTFAPMPNVAALAARGLRFTNAYAQPVCSPTRASILTGRYAFRHGVGAPEGATLPSSELTIPEIFTANFSPHALASFGKWHLGGGNNGPATLGGWPEFRGILGGAVTNYYDWSKTINGTTTAGNTSYTTSDQVDDAITFISNRGANPWFVWMGFNAPHSPFQNPPSALHGYPAYATDANGEVTAANRRSAYEAALQALDTEIGRLLASVDISNTDIILIGDNGTPGQVVQAPFDSTHAKDTLYQGGIRVPLVIAGPDVSITGTSQKLVHCVDLFSTVLELAGIDVAAATSAVDKIDSQSLVPVMKGQDAAARCIVSERFKGSDPGDGRSILSSDFPGYKLIVHGDPTTSTDTPSYELFKVSSDENEQSPVAISNSAYTGLVAKDTGIGPAAASGATLYLELPTTPTGASGVPINDTVLPDSITVNGMTATFVARFNQADTYNQYWVKCTVPGTVTPPYTSAVVAFPNNPMTGDTRVFNAINIVTAP